MRRIKTHEINNFQLTVSKAPPLPKAVTQTMGCIFQLDSQDSYICINCGCFLPALYEKYGEFHIRLSLCPHCNMVADKYIEYDNVLLFIDLIILKPTAYRHTIYNVFLAPNREPFIQASSRKSPTSPIQYIPEHSRKPNKYMSLKPLVFRLGILMLLFEVYITWASQEKGFIQKEEHTSLITRLVLGSPLQYTYFLTTILLQNGLLCLCLTYFGLIWLPFKELQHEKVSIYKNNQRYCRQSSPMLNSSSLISNGSNYTQTLRYQSRKVSDKLNLTLTPSKGEGFSFLNYRLYRDDSCDRYEDQKKRAFWRLLQVMIATVLVSNIIKLFPIVMLIWPYDSPILFATILMVRIVHLLLLVEAIHIVMIDPGDFKKRNKAFNLVSPSSSYFMHSNSVYSSHSSSNDYYKIMLVVLMSDFVRFLITHVIVAFFASTLWDVSVREIGLDDWRMMKVAFKMIEELGEYILATV